VEPAVVKGAPRNGAGELVRARLHEGAYVFKRCQSPRRDYRNGNRFRERDRGVEIEALQHAVAGDDGVDDGAHARILEALSELEHPKFRRRGPALDRDFAVTRVKPDRNAAGMQARRFPDKLWVANRRRADDHAVDALFEPTLDGRHVADAAAELDRARNGLQDALDRGLIDRLTRERPVEIDDVQIFEPLGFERVRLPGRVAVKHDRARHVALLEANGDTVLEIDCREQDHGAHFRKLAMS